MAIQLNATKVAEREARDERKWRDDQLLASDDEIKKHDDNHPGKRGAVGLWRQYRNELRDWPDDPNFPDPVHRPVEPA